MPAIASMHPAFEQALSGPEVVAVGEHKRQRPSDEPRALKRVLVRCCVPSGHVERLRAVRERVHRGPPALSPRDQVRPAAAVCHPTGFVADREGERPLGARVGGRY